MNKILTLLCSAIFALIATALPVNDVSTMNNARVKIMVISDPHLLAPSLHDAGAAAQHLDKNDMKMVLQSDLIVERMIDSIIAEHPQLLLISGDLTFNGARASHERLVSHLQRLSQAGIKSLVIPGNHDVNCPYSKSYLGDDAKSVATVSAEEFAELYSPYGYGAASERDPNSLSYTCEPVAGLVLLCIDSNRYSENRVEGVGEVVEYHNDGLVKPETLDWVRAQLAKARAGGKRVVAMMHHHLVEHIDGESKLLPNYIVANHEEVEKVLREGGVKVVFTGHLHITDAATINAVVDVATGSASTFPLPMRVATLDLSHGTLSVETRFFDGIDDGLIEQGKIKVENSAGTLTAMVSRLLWSKLDGRMEQLQHLLASQGMEVKNLPQDAQQLNKLLLRHLREPLTRSVVSVSRGGEDPQMAAAVIDAIRQGVREMIVELMPENGSMMADFLIEELFPRVEPMLKSALEDVNQVGTGNESRTHDHALVISLD